MRKLMSWTRGQPAPNPTDDVFLVHEMDACDDMANMVIWTMLRFDEVLDAEMLRDALAHLATIGDWRKLGARIRRNAAGKLEYHIPKQFTEDRPTVSFTSEVHHVRVDDHELGRKLPRVTPGKASVQAGCATFNSFAPPPEAPRTLKDYLRSGAPLLWLHVVTFADATLVTLGWPHMAMDGVGLSQVLQAWAVVLAGGDEFVPPMLSLRHDLMGALTAKDGPAAKIAEEEFFMAEEMVTNVLLFFLCIAYLVLSLMLGDKTEQHMVWVPKATLVKLRQEALAGLEALDDGAAPGLLGSKTGGAELGRNGTAKNTTPDKGGVDEKLFPRGIVADRVTGKPFISENDALMAFFTRAAARGRPRISRRPVNLFSVVDVRDRIPTVTASIPGATHSVFLTNMVMSVQTLLPARIFCGDRDDHKTSSSSSSSEASSSSPTSLGVIAGAVRSHVAAGTTEPQLRAKGRMMVKAVRDHLPATAAMAGAPRIALIMFSSLDVGTMYDSNMFEPAVVKRSGRLEDGNDDAKTGDSQQPQGLKGCTPVAFMVPRSGNVRLMSKMQLFTIGRGRDGAWVQGCLRRDVWKMVEEELAEIERR